MAYLDFVEDQKLEKIITNVLTKGKDAISNVRAEKKFHYNVIDPFSVIFEMASFEMSLDQWTTNEKTRQAQKTLSNAIGNFHQDILGSIDDWQCLATGNIVDIVNHDKKIIAEIKNKHNTLKGSDKSGLYSKLEDLVMRKGHTYKWLIHLRCRILKVLSSYVIIVASQLCCFLFTSRFNSIR
jgi:Eco47II restriction endonuclease